MKALQRFTLGLILFLAACVPAASPSLPSGTRLPAGASVTPALLPEEPPPARAEAEFKTDFSRHTVPYSEILSGGPPKEGIPAIDHPRFVTVEEANAWLRDQEPVVLVQVGHDSRAYPIQVLIWHEIVNDTVGDEPLIVSFCPLCNTAIAFKRTFNGQVLDFGTTGRLRYSNLIMYDRQTETWWQQATGDAIAGELSGGQLEFYPASMISWQDFKFRHPDGQVLSRETGHTRSYGDNPYVGYDDINQVPFLFSGSTPDPLPPMARVLTVDLNGEAVAYPYELLREQKVINDSAGREEIVVFWAEGTASAQDTRDIPEGREVGAAVAYSRVLDGQILTFEFKNEKFLDQQTGSEWNLFGQATSGELNGKQLSPLVSINHFWFSWAAFKPDTQVYRP